MASTTRTTQQLLPCCHCTAYAGVQEVILQMLRKHLGLHQAGHCKPPDLLEQPSRDEVHLIFLRHILPDPVYMSAVKLGYPEHVMWYQLQTYVLPCLRISYRATTTRDATMEATAWIRS